MISRNKIGKEQAQICLEKLKHFNFNSRIDNCDTDRYIHHDNQEFISSTKRVIELIKMDEGECVQGSGSGAENVLTALTHTWHIISVVTQG